MTSTLTWTANTLMDPYHVVNNIDNSLISKDAHFDGASVPLPALEQKKSGKLRLGLGINMAERSSPIPEYTQKGAEENQEQLCAYMFAFISCGLCVV